MSIKKQTAFQNKDCFSRMNFLYQASMLMAGRNNTLSAYYGRLCRNVGKKAVLRIDPNIKRDICKRCSLSLQPGITADISVGTRAPRRKKRKHAQAVINVDQSASIQITCKTCGYIRHFNVNPEYNFWLEQPESVAETVVLENESTKQNAV